ncbi:hypothetical protein BLSTO_06509 [Blastocystis sp. subtype 1]
MTVMSDVMHVLCCDVKAVMTIMTHTTWTHNIFFNVPRAGININDAFGGGNLVDHSLMFNTVRETADHGPLNTWDRMPFITTYDSGEPSTKPQESSRCVR